MTSPYDSVRYRSLDGAGVLVTGGASGIGADLVRAFASQGAQVRFLDIDEDAGAALAASVPGSSFRHCDLRDIAALREAVAATERAFAIDVLVNNAARDDRHDMFDVEPQGWRDALAVNLDHQFFATQAVARAMRERKRGSIVLTGSISWMRGRPGLVGYTTAKAAINGMNKTLARELGEHGIRINCIVPGALVTARQEALWRSPEIDAEIMRLQALKVSLDATHVARMALFLGSDESGGCTGANFVVDAGLTQN